jgi:membrane-bound inhibitor of C-type lysozyme
MNMGSGETAMSKRMPLHVVATLALLVGVASCQSADSERQTADVIGPVTFHCDDDSQIVAIFDNSRDPATARLVRGDQRAVVPQAVSADGARYVSDDITFWNKGDDAMVEWHGTSLDCTAAE